MEAGRYNNVSEVVRSALRLLQEAEDRRLHFHGMLKAAEAEAAREGTYAIEDVLVEADSIIDAADR